MRKFIDKIKKILLKSKIATVIFVFLIAGAVYFGAHYFFSEKESFGNEVVQKEKEVEVFKINQGEQNKSVIETVGSVKAEAKVEVVALVGGTVSSDFFNIGDEVVVNQVLTDLYSNALLTNYTNAQTNYFNAVNSFENTELLTNESVRQAELGVQNAEESIKSAEIALKNAQENLTNSITLQDKGVLDTQDTAISSFYSYLNTVNSSLDQINYIIHAEDGIQLAGISGTLSVKNQQSLLDAKGLYINVKNNYKKISSYFVNRNNIREVVGEAVLLLEETKTAVDKTIEVLNNTITSSDFTDAQLSAQLTSFSTLRSTVVGSLLSAQATLQSLENAGLQNKQSLDALKNAVASAENQLRIAELGYNNAVIALNNAKQGKEQQLIGAKSSIDGAEGQLSLIGNQVVDMTIRAPIAGKITGKYIELGAELNPGQKVAEISQTENVKIETSLSSEDIYRIDLGQKVFINKDIEANITTINPSADPVTKKVKIEILINNLDNKLIPGTFVDVSIPLEKIEQTKADSFFIPLKAVIVTQNESFVFAKDENMAKKIKVKLGKAEGSFIEVLEGLSEGMEIIIEGAKNLKEGDIVEIKK